MTDVNSIADMTERVIYLNGEKVVLDPKRMQFDEQSLATFNKEVYMWVNYFGLKLAEADLISTTKEAEYKFKYDEKYELFKSEGATDKLAEARAGCDLDVKTAKMASLEAKNVVLLLKNHLKAWDVANENAQSRGHFLRKEMDKLNVDIYSNDLPNFKGSNA